jgi:uncharacterized protein (DUF927 family)
MDDLWRGDAAEPVYWVEGELCVHTFMVLGATATTAGGASDVASTDFSRLPPGRAHILWPDNDAPGRQHMDQVAANLLARNEIVHLIDIEALGLPSGGDVVDWHAAHPQATLDDLRHLPVRILTKNTGGTGDAGDIASRKASPVPGGPPASETPGTDDAETGFTLDAGAEPPGVYFAQVLPATKTLPERTHLTWVCGPLSVTHATRDGAQMDWGRRLTFIDADGRSHEYTMPMTLLAGDGRELREELLRQGLALSGTSDARRLLLRYLETQTPTLRARCTNRTGWHDDAFVLPDETLLGSGREPMFYQAITTSDATMAGSGDLTQWREYVAVPCIGNPRLVFAVGTAFAAIILGLLGLPGCIHHWRGSSSIGKSTLLQLAASVFGPPNRYMVTWRQTDNGLEGVAHQHTDLLLVLDELGQLDPKAAGRVAYMLAEGTGKVRANRSGEARKPARWRVLGLSSGEISLSDLMAQAGDIPRAGQDVRVIDLPADADQGLGVFTRLPENITAAVFAEALADAARTYYGTALPAFVRAIQSDLANARVALLRGRDELAEEMTQGLRDGQVRRVAQQLALVAAAVEFAGLHGLTGWPPNEGERAAQAIFKQWLAQRGTSGNLEPVVILERLQAAIEKHGLSRFIPWTATPEEAARVRDCLGYVDTRQGDNGAVQVFYVFRAGFKEIIAGYNERTAARVLADQGVLDPDPDGEHWTRSERLPGRGKLRVYKLTPHAYQGRSP